MHKTTLAAISHTFFRSLSLPLSLSYTHSERVVLAYIRRYAYRLTQYQGIHFRMLKKTLQQIFLIRVPRVTLYLFSHKNSVVF